MLSIDGVASVDLSRTPSTLTPEPLAARLYLGYAGWGPGQLDGELSAAAWIAIDPQVGDLFDHALLGLLATKCRVPS